MRACLLPLVLLPGCPSASGPVGYSTPTSPLELPGPTGLVAEVEALDCQRFLSWVQAQEL